MSIIFKHMSNIYLVLCLNMFPPSSVWLVLGHGPMGFTLASFSQLKHDLNKHLMLKYGQAGAETRLYIYSPCSEHFCSKTALTGESQFHTSTPPAADSVGCEAGRETCGKRETGTGQLCEIKWDYHIVGTRA